MLFDSIRTVIQRIVSKGEGQDKDEVYLYVQWRTTLFVTGVHDTVVIFQK